MRTIKLLFFVAIFLTTISASGQSAAQKNQLALDQVSISSDWIDPYFPRLDTPDELLNYATNIEAYAKDHPAFPVLRIADPTKEQLEKYEQMVDEWMQQFGQYFPVFVEYSKFDKRLSANDDYSIYFAAREEWYKQNPDKAKILEEEIGLWISTNQDKYNSIMTSK